MPTAIPCEGVLVGWAIPAVPCGRGRIAGATVDRLSLPSNIAARLEARGEGPGQTKTVASARTRRIDHGAGFTLRGCFAARGLAPSGARPRRR